jgi:hypothetical protein
VIRGYPFGMVHVIQRNPVLVLIAQCAVEAEADSVDGGSNMNEEILMKITSRLNKCLSQLARDPFQAITSGDSIRA